MVNIGTLAAFTLVSLAVPVLRRRRPDLKRSFKVPGNPVLPWIAAAASVYLMLTLPAETWVRFIAWMLVGLVFYFAYSRQNSRLAKHVPQVEVEDLAHHEHHGGNPAAGGTF